MMFENYENTIVDFYGVDGNCFKIDDIVFEGIEDPDDGYRSYLKSIEINKKDREKFIFFKSPITKVKIVKVDSYRESLEQFIGWDLVDIRDDHIWLSIGTGNSNDYYPYFVFQYYPKMPFFDLNKRVKNYVF